MGLLSVVLFLLSIGLSVFFVIEAWKDAWWKGLLVLFCGLYLIYWALFEFDHEYKLLVLLLWGLLITGGWYMR